MKQRLLLILLSLLPLAAHAQTTHSPGFWVAGSAELISLPKASPAQGGWGEGASVGFDYRYRHGHFLLRTGVGVSWSQNSFTLANASVCLPNQTDQNGYPFSFMYDVRGREDTYMRLGAELPLMVGGEFGRFFFLVGAKAKWAFRTTYESHMRLTTWGDYPDFADPMRNMPTHQFFTDKPYEDKGRVSLRPDVAASLELGAHLTEAPTRVSLSLFVDYGLLPLAEGKGRALLSLPQRYNPNDMFSPVHAATVFSAVPAGEKASAICPMAAISTLSFGARLTVAFPQLEKKHKRYPCMCVRF